MKLVPNECAGVCGGISGSSARLEQRAFNNARAKTATLNYLDPSFGHEARFVMPHSLIIAATKKEELAVVEGSLLTVLCQLESTQKRTQHKVSKPTIGIT